MTFLSTLSSKQKGDQFEDAIAQLYEAMGYRVSRNIPVCGQEVDIFAERVIPGGGPYRIMVECKYKSRSDRAGNEDVQSIAGAFSIAKTSGAVSACTLVTTNGFTLEAQEAARGAGIYLITKRRLIKSLIDFSPYLEKLRALFYEDFGTGEDSWYIDPKAKRNDEEIESLDRFLDDWLVLPSKSPVALLGTYGTGKTSFCRHYAVRLIDKSEGPIPIVLQLRHFHKAMKIESLIRDFLDEQCNCPSPRFDTFWRIYSEGLVLLLLDGFDEMALRVDSSVLEANLLEIERFARVTGNVILTCRPEFFITQKEQNSALVPIDDPLSERMAIYEPVQIKLWSLEQVIQFVEKRIEGMKPTSPYPPKYYIDRIESLPELSDMSVRAVHLELILRLLPTMIERNILLTRPNLYREYIKRELRRETIQNKRLRLISDDDRLALMQAVAADRFLESHDAIDFESASKIIQEKLKVPKSEVESVTRDFLNRSFLTRDGDEYHFAHKSLGEYLLANELFENIKKKDLSFFCKTNYSSAVAGMVLELFGGANEFEKLIAALRLGDDPFKLEQTYLSRMLFIVESLNDYIQNVLVLRRRRSKDGSLDKSSRFSLERFWGLAHDSNNEMSVIKTFIQLFLKKDKDYSKREIFRERMVYHVPREWMKLLLRFQQLKHFEFNRLTFELRCSMPVTEIDLVSLIRSATSCIPEHKVQIRGKCRPYHGNEDYLARAFENIVLNGRWGRC